MSNIREVGSKPFHPLFAAITNRAAKTGEGTIIYDDANSRVALVNYAEKLLHEIFNKQEKSIADYNADTERLKKSYGSMSWFSWNFAAKLYAGLNLRIPLNDFINLAELGDEIKQNIMFKDALELLSDAKLIELENKHMKVRITDTGKEYLRTLK